MTWHRAQPSDVARITAFLAPRVQTSMFLLANLANHGLNSDSPRGLTLWYSTEGADLRGVFTLSNEGMLFLQLPQPRPADWPELQRLCAGRPVIGAIGHAGQVRAALSGLGLDGQPCQSDSDELGFDLSLSALRMPDVTGLRLSRPGPGDGATLRAMREVYLAEVLGTPPAQRPAQAARDIDGYLARDSHRLLWRGDHAVGMTGFNATWQDTAQVGGVFTLPHLRGQGLARAAVALHLHEARAAGYGRAVLFAVSDVAARVYRAIGFAAADPVAMVLFSEQTVVPCR